MIRLGVMLLMLIAAIWHVPIDRSPLILTVLAGLGALLAWTVAMPLVIYAGVWSAFVVLRAHADDLGFPDRSALVVELDRWLGAGTTLTVRLQQALYSSGQTDWLDHLAIWTHASYFFVPHVAAVALWWWGRTRDSLDVFRAYLYGTLITMVVGLMLFALAPVAPPWLQAAQSSPSQLNAERVVRASNPEQGSGDNQVYTVVADQNPVAAMPSLHMAVTLLVALITWRVSRTLGLFGIAYAVAMGFSLVYLGEHYLIDVVAGSLLAIGVILAVAAGREGRSAVDEERGGRSRRRPPRP